MGEKSEKIFPLRQVRSFVRRDSRMTKAQRRAYETLWPDVGLELKNGLVNFSQVFQREKPCVLEIGFGSGQSLLAMANNYPEENFIGIETHLPGIGALMLGMQSAHLKNIRIFYAD